MQELHTQLDLEVGSEAACAFDLFNTVKQISRVVCVVSIQWQQAVWLAYTARVCINVMETSDIVIFASNYLDKYNMSAWSNDDLWFWRTW